jgi:hypothetical protein
MVKERVQRNSKSKKEDSQDDEVGSKRIRQLEQAKRAKASRLGPSPPSPPRKGFKMLPTGEFSDSVEEEGYPDQNVRATCQIQTIIQQLEQTVQVEMPRQKGSQQDK